MTGYDTPAADPQTGPAILNAPPAGSGATATDLPVSGSITPMLWLEAYAMRPPVSAPTTGEGVGVAAVDPPHALRSTAAISGVENWMSLGAIE